MELLVVSLRFMLTEQKHWNSGGNPVFFFNMLRILRIQLSFITWSIRITTSSTARLLAAYCADSAWNLLKCLEPMLSVEHGTLLGRSWPMQGE
jgi:hypothetical protein